MRVVAMRVRRPVVASVAVLLALPVAVATGGGTGAAAADCHPFTTTATYDPSVPTAKSVLGFDLGQREVTTAESDRYLRAIDAASPLVAGSVLGTSHQGRSLTYAVVGTAARVAAAKAAATTLRNPATTPAQARATAASAPAILWVAGNVHGGEESGTDASLRVLYELAARTDCAAAQIRDNAVVAILPTQNPDGRELDTRRNAYGFDMNRDWFARTQPETDGKLEALRQYPPVLFIDSHEMGSKDYFFPPNADPIYHEITDESVSWINDTYGAAMQQEFDRQKIPYFNYAVYDMFYMGYGDTVPTAGFLGAGMTFEKSAYDGIGKRLYEQYVAIWTSLSAAAGNKASILEGWAASWREAMRQGTAGELEENEVVQPDNTVQNEVPDLTIRHYFLRADDPAKAAEVQALVRRLQRMDVQVRRLTAPLVVPDYTPYAGSPASTTLPVGTYWVPMAQAQKHWVQAMLNEDTYTPFPYFYDVTAWSQPLLFNVAGGRSGAQLTPSSQVVPALAAPAEPALPADTPTVAVWQMSTGTGAIESSGWLRWLLDKKWQLPHDDVTAADIATGALAGTDVLVVPDGDAAAGEKALGKKGVQVLRDWVAAGGRLVGLSEGAVLAGRLGVTGATFASPTSDIPGSLVRASVGSGPLAAGVGGTVWNFVEYDPVLRASDPASVAVSYQPATFAVSGFAEGEDELVGTAAVTDEGYGAGRVVLFASDPNFRAFTDGTQKVLWNALVGPDPAGLAAGTAAARAAAVSGAGAVPDVGDALLVTVRPGSVDQARRVLTSYGLSASTATVGANVRLRVAGFGSTDENPVSRSLVRDLTRLGAGVVAVRLP
jgi:hypothetical protein